MDINISIQSNQQKLVTVIIPAYNAEKYIRETIESVLNQTWKNLQLIIVNDGSADNTSNILNSFSYDTRIRVIEQINQGCSSAKNTGLNYAKGDYIQYLDADDLLSEDKIVQQVKVLENEPFGIAVCKTVVFHHTDFKDTGSEIDTGHLYSTDNSFEFLMNLYGKNGKIGMIQPNAFLLSRALVEKIGEWNTSLSPSPDEDGEYFCRAILAASKIFYTNGVNYYRKIKNVASLSKGRSCLFAMGAFRSVQLKAKHVMEITNAETVKRILANQYASVAYLYGSDYPEIVSMVKEELNKMGIYRIPTVGGLNFKIMSSIIGFDNAMRVKTLLKNKQIF